MKSIELTRSYLQFAQGYVFDHVALVRKNSIEVLVNGRKYDIPRAYCKELVQFNNSIPAPAAPHGSVSATVWQDDEMSLSGLMGSTPMAPSKPADPTPKPVKKPVLSLEDNQVLMSHFTNGKLPDSEVDHVINMYPSETWDEEHWVNIPDIDPNYVWNPNMLEALIMGLDDNERVLLVGLPGTGKTTGHKQFAAIIGQPFYAVNGKDGMEPSSYLGAVAPDKQGGWEWSDGALPSCMKDGYYLCIDEVFKIPAGIQMSMQSVWERGGHLVLDDKPGSLLDKLVKPDGKFRLVATDNVKGTGDNFAMFSGTQMQDTSTLDRFDTTYTVPYMDEEDEVEMLTVMFDANGVECEVIGKLVQIANLVRKGYATEEIALTLSPRGLMSCCRKLKKGLKPMEAFRYAYLEKLADQIEIDAVTEFANTCGLMRPSYL